MLEGARENAFLRAPSGFTECFSVGATAAPPAGARRAARYGRAPSLRRPCASARIEPRGRRQAPRRCWVVRAVVRHVAPGHQSFALLVEVGRRHAVGERLTGLNLELDAALGDDVPLHGESSRSGILPLRQRGVVADVLRPRRGELDHQLAISRCVRERHVLVGEGVVQRRVDARKPRRDVSGKSPEVGLQ